MQSAVKGSSNSLTTLMELRQVHSVMAHSVAECIMACSCFFVFCQAALRFVKGLERALASVDGKIVVVVFTKYVSFPPSAPGLA